MIQIDVTNVPICPNGQSKAAFFGEANKSNFYAKSAILIKGAKNNSQAIDPGAATMLMVISQSLGVLKARPLYREAAFMSNEEIVARIQAGEEEMYCVLWEQVERLVAWKANHIMTAMEGCLGRGVEFDDLYQSGYPAMVMAVESYDSTAGAFSTWFIYHLKTAFAEVTGYRTKKDRFDPLNNALSMDEPLTDEADSSLFGDFIPDQRAAATMEAVEDREYQKQLHDALEIALGAVPENYGEVLRLRYYQDMTLEECGDVLGVGAERVRQMERRGLRFLRQPKNAACLRPFFDFNFFCYTGMSAFLNSGMSVQERYLIAEEEQQRKAEARRQKRERRRRVEKTRDDYEITMDQLMADVNARISAMTPEEKQAMLEKYVHA